jgi:hypothetical protein
LIYDFVNGDFDKSLADGNGWIGMDGYGWMDMDGWIWMGR